MESARSEWTCRDESARKEVGAADLWRDGQGKQAPAETERRDRGGGGEIAHDDPFRALKGGGFAARAGSPCRWLLAAAAHLDETSWVVRRS